MTDSLQQFMSGIIDYAGLFPPAKLPLDEAIRNYAKYRQGHDNWMLSRFIIPASKLNELDKYADELFSDDEPFAFSVLGGKTETVEGFKEEVNTVINLCNAFGEKHPGLVSTDMLEVKLPHDAARSQDIHLIGELMDDTAEQLQSSPLAPSVIVYEGLFDESWQADNKAIILALADHNNKFSSDRNYHSAAYKIRCGGVTADLFPSVEQVAFILNSTKQNNVALKGTAGLHHPVRHYADEVQTKMHGFFNVFGGAMLAHANDIGIKKLEEIIKDENPDSFQFSENKFSWNNYSVSTDEIKKLRKNVLLSYGSCSFDEPREDLQKLGLL